MSNRAERRAHGHRSKRSRFAESEWWAVQPGWAADEEHLEEVRKLTHDALIGSMGPRRTGGVRWLTTHDPSKGIRICEDNLGQSPTPAELNAWGEIARLLNDEGGILVIATAPGTKP